MGDQKASRWSVLTTVLASLKGHSANPRAITVVFDKREKAEIYLAAETVEAQACQLLGRLTSKDQHGWIELLTELILSTDERASVLYEAFKKISPFHGKVLLLRMDLNGHDAVLGDVDEMFALLLQAPLQVTTWQLSIGGLAVYERTGPEGCVKNKQEPSKP